MNVTPVHDRLIVHRIDEGEQNVGGIIVPDSAKQKYSGQEIKIDGQDYLIMREDDVLAIIDSK